MEVILIGAAIGLFVVGAYLRVRSRNGVQADICNDVTYYTLSSEAA